MYRNEGFEQVGKITEGELVMKLPGTDLVFPYSAGVAYVNSANNVGQLDLISEGFTARATGEPEEGVFGELGKGMRLEFESPETREAIRDAMSGNPLHFFYSRTVGGAEVLTLPSMRGEDGIDTESASGVIVAEYSMSGALPSIDLVYGLFCTAIGDSDLVSDRGILKQEVLHLTDKVNQMYVEALEIMKRASF